MKPHRPQRWILILAISISVGVPLKSSAQPQIHSASYPNLKVTIDLIDHLEMGSRISAVRFRTFVTTWHKIINSKNPMGKSVTTYQPVKRISTYRSGTLEQIEGTDSFKTRNILRLKGKLKLLNVVYGPPISSRVVDEKVYLADHPEWNRRDPQWDQLYPFLSVSLDSLSCELLMFWPRHSKHFKDATVVGPIGRADLKHLSELQTFLKGKSIYFLTEADCERMANSSNPWLVYFGITKLGEMEKLTAQHFAKALRTVPKENIRTLVEDAFYVASQLSGRFEADLQEEYMTFFADTDPDRQHCILAAVIEQLKKTFADRYNPVPRTHTEGSVRFDRISPHRFFRLMDKEFHKTLTEAATAYRSKIAHDPQRAKIVWQMDTLLMTLQCYALHLD